LEEDVNVLQERRLIDIVQQFSKAKVNKVLEEEAKARLQRRANRLLKLEKLYTLAKEHGYAFSTIFCMLLELQIHRINEIIQFVIDARHYLFMEYSLSSVRNVSIRETLLKISYRK
jgi:histidyl-tRNA synthetase